MDDKPLFRARNSSYMSWVGARTQSTLKRSPSNIKTLWLDSQHQASRDFRSRSGRGCLWVLITLWFIGLTAGFIVLCIWSTWERSDSVLRSACLPDESFNLWPSTYQYWGNSGFFQITLGGGALTFTQAKAIDVVWDIIVGRGGQALIAYLSWQTFVRYVTTSMEVQPVTFNTFRTVFLQNESLILAIPRIIRDFSRRRGLQSRFAMAFIVITMLFVLIFPTLGSAMTGYSGNVEAYVPDSDNNNIPFSSFRPLYYIVHDGDRIGLTKDYEVTSYPENGDPVMDTMLSWTQRTRYPLDVNCVSRTYDGDRCVSYQRVFNVSAYVGQYRGLRDESSVFAGSSLDPPLLNISSYYTSTGYESKLASWRSIPSFNYSMWLNSSGPAENMANPRSWSASGELFTYDRIEDNGVCQATKNYQWGFSFIQLMIMMILLWLWTIGITMMWASAKLTMKQRGREEVAGEYKAVFELADAMREQLEPLQNEDAKDVCEIDESTLRRRIAKDLRGGTIAYETCLLSEEEKSAASSDWSVRGWAKREAWWLLALVTSMIATGLCIRTFLFRGWRGDLFIFWALPFALIFSMFVGTTHRSRGMVLFWATLVVCVLPGIVLGALFGSLA